MVKKNDSELDHVTLVVQSFFKKHEKFKAIETQYKQLEVEFNEEMDSYFGSMSNRRKSETFQDTNGDGLMVTKAERTHIEWLPEKLKARVERSVWKKLVVKHYEVSDMDGLIRYLKSCGVDPQIFKSFIEVTETVDEKAVERLGDLGELTPHNIAGCYLVKSSKPYYKLKRKLGNVEQEPEP